MINVTPSAAEDLAIRALAWLAGDSDQLVGFLDASGATADDLRIRAQDADFPGFVLDFILSEESRARQFCLAEHLSAEHLHTARAALPGGQVPDWT